MNFGRALASCPAVSAEVLGGVKGLIQHQGPQFRQCSCPFKIDRPKSGPNPCARKSAKVVYIVKRVKEGSATRITNGGLMKPL